MLGFSVFCSQGEKAKINGQKMPEALCAFFVRCGYQETTLGDYKHKRNLPALGFVHGVQFRDYTGRVRKNGIVLFNRDLGRTIRVWSKYQEASGSVDEKLPDLLHCVGCFPEDEVVFIVDGGAAKKPIVEWLKMEVERKVGVSGRTHVWDLKEFLEYFCDVHHIQCNLPDELDAILRFAGCVRELPGQERLFD